jgi:hypothetical protein
MVWDLIGPSLWQTDWTPYRRESCAKPPAWRIYPVEWGHYRGLGRAYDVHKSGTFNAFVCNIRASTLPSSAPLGGMVSFMYKKCYIKGSVQRKLRWVEHGVNRSVGASDCGAEHSFVVLFRFHLGFATFPFPVSTTQIIGEFWINRWSGASDVAPIVLAPYSRNR